MKQDNALSRIAASKKIAAEGKRSINIATFSNFNHKALNDLITFNLNDLGCYPSFYDGIYSDYFPHVLGNASDIKAFGAQFHFYVLDTAFIENDIGSLLPTDDIRETIQEHKNRLAYLLNFSTADCDAHVVLNTIHIAESQLKHVIAQDQRVALKQLIDEFNANLLALGQTEDRVTVVDLQENGGIVEDPATRRTAQLLGLGVGLDALDAIARSGAVAIRQALGKTLKCVVSDLDNTLWKGILADDGVDGILMADKHIGTGHLRYQEYLRHLYDQGIILAICSKNNLENVEEAFKRRADEMRISLDKFSVVSANWQSKSGNILNIANELNISPEHMLFIDDSAFECAEVKTRIPEITVLDFSGDVSENVAALINADYFLRPTISSDDRMRNLSYAQNKRRTELQKEFTDDHAFLTSLGMTLTILPVEESTLDRVSQLTLRTNQFNMTTQRMTAQDVAGYLSREGHLAVTLACRDRIGDYGTIGAIFLHFDGDGCHIDNFIMSCRIFGRQVEFAAMRWLFDLCQTRGVDRITAVFGPTEKNGKFQRFYPDCGFTETTSNVFTVINPAPALLADNSNTVTVKEGK
ncbi:HAD-IIIC family phosphatase [Dickeya chrysanthemi]|uniref:HAD-IIIC family phosphatase n=1 Tax=Dickeya chrysanthemi TaxID=556 RepID=UPI0003A5736F|nr:HAD-IIIC family phosphatase [Dickeya chrysanthemi]MBX9445120.1 HAD-IIIC family phosphatase [Dickeya chrysanthemi]